MGPIQREQPERTQTRIGLLAFTAMQQDLRMSPEAQTFVDGVRKKLGYEDQAASILVKYFTSTRQPPMLSQKPGTVTSRN